MPEQFRPSDIGGILFLLDQVLVDGQSLLDTIVVISTTSSLISIVIVDPVILVVVALLMMILFVESLVNHAAATVSGINPVLEELV